MDNKVSRSRNFKVGSNLDNLNAGIKKSDLNSASQIKLFEKLDKDANGVLTQNEVQELLDSLSGLVKDGKITKREAKKLLKEYGLKGEADNNEVFEFLKQLGKASENINKTTNSTWNDGVETLDIEYKADEKGQVVTDIIDLKSGKLYAQKTVKDGTTTLKFFDEEGNIKSSVTEKGSVKEYLDAEGYVTKRVTSKGLGLQDIVKYERNLAGEVISETTTKADGTIIIKTDDANITKTPDGKMLIEKDSVQTLVLPNGREIQTTFENDIKKTVIKDGENTVEIKYDEAGNIISGAKNDESFAQTAKRLGIEQGTPEFEKFKELNASAAKNGWFLVGAEVKVPAGMEEKINIAELNIDAKAEMSDFFLNHFKQLIRHAEINSTDESSEVPKREEVTPPTQHEDEIIKSYEDIAAKINSAVSKKILGIIPTTGDWLDENVKKINPYNAEDILNIYSDKYGETIFDAIIKERGLSVETRAEYLKYIKNQLVTCLHNRYGMYTDDISLDFDREINYQLKKVGFASTEYFDSFIKKLNARRWNSTQMIEANGKIDKDFKQNQVGDCWLLASIKAIAQTPKGLQILNDSINVDKKGNVSVTLKGAGKTYIITPEELKGRSEFSYGDGDVRALEIAFDRYFLEERGVNFRPDLHGNTPHIAFQLLTGKGGRNILSNYFGRLSEFWFTDSQIDNFNKENHVAVVFSPEQDNDFCSYSDPVKNGENITLRTYHAYMVKGSDKNYVYVINPWDTSEVISVPRNVFKDFFKFIDEFDL